MGMIIVYAVNAPTTFLSWAVKAMFRFFGVLWGLDSSEPVPGVSPTLPIQIDEPRHRASKACELRERNQ